jgi:hypothetical protein
MYSIRSKVNVKVVRIIGMFIKNARREPEIMINTDYLFGRITEGRMAIKTISIPNITEY